MFRVFDLVNGLTLGLSIVYLFAVLNVYLCAHFSLTHSHNYLYKSHNNLSCNLGNSNAIYSSLPKCSISSIAKTLYFYASIIYCVVNVFLYFSLK